MILKPLLAGEKKNSKSLQLHAMCLWETSFATAILMSSSSNKAGIAFSILIHNKTN
jgi:hypothetical protein